jgi:hypothetical protein
MSLDELKAKGWTVYGWVVIDGERRPLLMGPADAR